MASGLGHVRFHRAGPFGAVLVAVALGPIVVQAGIVGKAPGAVEQHMAVQAQHGAGQGVAEVGFLGGLGLRRAGRERIVGGGVGDGQFVHAGKVGWGRRSAGKLTNGPGRQNDAPDSAVLALFNALPVQQKHTGQGVDSSRAWCNRL